MVEKLIMSLRNVIDLARYQQRRVAGQRTGILDRLCRHCGAALADGENEDECSSTFNLVARRRRCGAIEDARGVKARSNRVDG